MVVVGEIDTRTRILCCRLAGTEPTLPAVTALHPFCLRWLFCSSIFLGNPDEPEGHPLP